VLNRRRPPVDPYPRSQMDNTPAHDARTKWLVLAGLAAALGFIGWVCYTQFTGIVG